MMKKILLGLTLGIALFASCSKEVKQEEIVMQAAKAYYDQLLAGDVNSFVEGTLKGDTLPEDYREQLLLNAQMFLELQQKEHGGIKSIEPVRATCDTTGLANAYLVLCYGDSTREEIVVPMVRRNDLWYLR